MTIKTQNECLSNEKIMAEIDLLINILIDHGLSSSGNDLSSIEDGEEWVKKEMSGDWKDAMGWAHELGQHLEWHGKHLQATFAAYHESEAEDGITNVTITLADGREVSGTYQTRDGMVHVLSGTNRKSTQIGSLEPRIVAEMLLREMVGEAG